MKVTLVITISENYIDVAHIFFNLLKINWKDCPYKIIVSYSGNIIKIAEYGDYQFSNTQHTLPYSIKKISDLYPSDYYICLLGDAFLSKAINTKDIENLILFMSKNRIEYCNLFPAHREKTIYKYIKKSDIYAVSFIAFIASKSFIDLEFSEKTTDFDFEEKYLIEAYKNIKNREIWNDKIINCSNNMNIIHGVQKGVWIRSSYKKLKHYKIIDENKRDIMTYRENFINNIRIKSQIILSPFIRYKLKSLFSKFGFKFSSKY